MRLILILLCAAPVLAAAPAFAQPSYNCNVRLNPTEKAICDDPGLAGLDTTMAGRFYAILETLPEARKASFQDEQTAWRRDRDACGPAVGCIRANYVFRIGQFDAMAGGGAGPQRVADSVVHPDGTIEKRRPDGGKVLLRPDGDMEIYRADGTRVDQTTIASNVQGADLPPLPQPLRPWATGLESSLLRILGNMLSEREYSAYLATESGKADYTLIDWRIRSITFLTQP